MISVVMPTLWRGEHYKEMLPALDAHPLIGEILVIDNDTSNTDHNTLSKVKKLTHYKPESNLYVNPSWNYGVKNCRFDKVCLYSDDVLFDLECIVPVYDFITPDNGIIGFHGNNVFPNRKSVYFSEWETKRIVVSNAMHFRYGICMFIHKESYCEIPEQFKIYYGDTILYNHNIKQNKNNWWILNYYAVTQMSTTSNAEEFKSIINQEKEEYKKL